MRHVTVFILSAAAAVFLSACGSAVANKPANAANSNTTTARSTRAEPTVDALFEIDREANEALMKGDTNFFEGFLSDKFVSFEAGQRMGKADILKMIESLKCDVNDWKLEDPQMARIGDDAVVLSYRGTFDGTCTGPDGKAMRLPSPTRAVSIYVREGGKWMGAYHGENLIFDPKALPTAASEGDKKDAAKEEPKRPAANKDTSPASQAADPNTDAMLALERSLWHAWKVKDNAKLEELTTRDLSFHNIFGTFYANKADTIKSWTGHMCDVKSVNISDAVGSMLSPNVGILTFKGTTDGTCEGQRIGVTWGMSIYVKDGASWKYAFGMNQPDKRG